MDSIRSLTIIFIIFASVNISSGSKRLSTCDKENQVLESACVCLNNNCGCCEDLNWQTFNIHGKVCTNVTYLPNDYGLSVTLTYNNYTLYNETLSARNPPPLCFGIPELEKLSAAICLRLHDLSFEKKYCHGCADVKVTVYHLISKTINLGCFDVPLDFPKVPSVKMSNLLHPNSIFEQKERKKKVVPSVKQI